MALIWCVVPSRYWMGCAYNFAPWGTLEELVFLKLRKLQSHSMPHIMLQNPAVIYSKHNFIESRMTYLHRDSRILKFCDTPISLQMAISNGLAYWISKSAKSKRGDGLGSGPDLSGGLHSAEPLVGSKLVDDGLEADKPSYVFRIGRWNTHDVWLKRKLGYQLHHLVLSYMCTI